ncbi:MAG: hypothetical protein JST10_10165 [Bacteroidetes bacterium]|nr:hypothetical protein [Bacteroidota bacterium]
MFKKKYHIIIALIVSALFYFLSFAWNDWLSLTMPRHQLLQLPSLFFLGIILSQSFPGIHSKETASGIGVLILVMASLVFWMLPRSVDLAVLHPGFNRVMHCNMLFAGFMTIIVFRKIAFEVKIIFLGMFSAMLLATGITLRVFDLLLCSSFTIEQQKETGLYLLIAASVLLITSYFIFFKGLSGKTDKKRFSPYEIY